MKKNLFFSLVCFFIASMLMLTSHAQIAKNEILLGGTFGYGNSNYSGGSTSNSNLSPRLGYAITNNSVLNVRLGFNYSKDESPNANRVNKNTGFGAGLSWENFFPIKDKLGWLTDISATFTTGTSRQEDISASNTIKSTSNGYTVALNPGIYFMPSESLLLSANVGGLSYSHSKYKSSGQPTGNSSNFIFNFLNYYSFSIDFIINKKKA
jgi:hypothetical protein